MRDTFQLADYLRRRLNGPLPGRDAQVRLAPRPRRWPDPDAVLRPAAALLLVYPHAQEWWMPLTVRVAGLRAHGGQVSLPGGRLDHPQESVAAAALREANEEIGLDPADVQVLGMLTPLPIAVSGYLLHPVVGAVPRRPAFAPAPDEVERVIEIPIARLLQPDVIAWERRALPLPDGRVATRRDEPAPARRPASAGRPGGVPGERVPTVLDIPYFDFGGARVWGATAMILAEFVALLEGLRP